MTLREWAETWSLPKSVVTVLAEYERLGVTDVAAFVLGPDDPVETECFVATKWGLLTINARHGTNVHGTNWTTQASLAWWEDVEIELEVAAEYKHPYVVTTWHVTVGSDLVAEWRVKHIGGSIEAPREFEAGRSFVAACVEQRDRRRGHSDAAGPG